MPDTSSIALLSSTFLQTNPVWSLQRRTRSGFGEDFITTSFRRTEILVSCVNRLKEDGLLPSFSAPLSRSGRKTLDVVHLVERSEDENSPNLRKATRLVAHTLLDALKDRVSRRKWVAALKVFKLLREQEWYQPDVGTYVLLLDMLGKCGQPDVACSVFQTMLEEKCRPSVQAYTALVSAYARNNRLDSAFSTMEEMKNVPNCHPDLFTYTSMIKACSEAVRFDLVDILLSEMTRAGLTPSRVTYNILIDSYGKAGMLKEMEDLFMVMREFHEFKPDVWTQNALLRNFARAGNIEAMEHWYTKLQSFGYEPDVITFNTLLHAYAKEGRYGKMESVRDFMHKYYYRGDVVTYNTVIDAYGKAGLINRMKRAYRQMKVQGVKEDTRTFCSLIDAFGKHGVWMKVEKILRQMRNLKVEPDTAIFNAALDAYRRAGKKAEMHQVLLEMEESGCQADTYTRTILSMAARNGKESGVKVDDK